MELRDPYRIFRGVYNLHRGLHRCKMYERCAFRVFDQNDARSCDPTNKNLHPLKNAHTTFNARSKINYSMHSHGDIRLVLLATVSIFLMLNRRLGVEPLEPPCSLEAKFDGPMKCIAHPKLETSLVSDIYLVTPQQVIRVGTTSHFLSTEYNSICS